MARVYLGLGANLGDREKNIRHAVNELNQQRVNVLKMSSIIETEPIGGPAQGKYLNAAVECLTQHNPEDLLEIITTIEKSMGRIRTVKDGPRVIDIDILLYENLILNLPHLIIPHPRMYTRDFVLRPLKEIAPHLFDQKSS